MLTTEQVNEILNELKNIELWLELEIANCPDVHPATLEVIREVTVMALQGAQKLINKKLQENKQ